MKSCQDKAENAVDIRFYQNVFCFNGYDVAVLQILDIKKNFRFAFYRFDANAPFTATAIGITTQIPRRPAHEWTLRNKNLANIYAGKKWILNLSKGHKMDLKWT